MNAAPPSRASRDAVPEPGPYSDDDPGVLLGRYARGRISHFVRRQVMTLVGGTVLALANGPVLGFAAVMLALAGEAGDCLVLRRVTKRLDRGAAVGPLIRLSTVTASLQAMTISGCVAMSWFGPVSHASPLFAVAFMASAAIDAGLALPYHPGAAKARLAVYAAAALILFAISTVRLDGLDPAFAMNAAGTVMLALMVALFLDFVSRSVRRMRSQTRELMRQSQRLAATNRQLAAREREATRLSLVARNANDSVVLTEPDGRIAWVNAAFTRITGFGPAEAIGRQPHDLLSGPETDPGTLAEIARSITAGRSFRGEIQNVTKSGEAIWIDTNIVPVMDEDGAVDMVVAIERDITAARRHAAELAEAKLAAEEGARAKADFLATMSHEIRTPMNGVLGMSDLLRDTDLDADQRLYADTIRASAQALLGIINDVLDFSKLDAERMELNPVPFDPAALVRGVVELLRPQAVEKRLDLVLDLQDLPPTLCADDARLRQILLNLLGNALKFTDSGAVVVRAGTTDAGAATRLWISVEDTGIGISEEKIDRISNASPRPKPRPAAASAVPASGLRSRASLLSPWAGRSPRGRASAKGRSSASTFPRRLPLPLRRVYPISHGSRPRPWPGCACLWPTTTASTVC
jgi:PAS domain S-box-containing protein